MRRGNGSGTFTLTGIWVVLGGFLACGCQPSNQVPSGPPALLSFAVLAPDGTAVPVTGADAVAAVPPLARFQALFDRILDATALEVLGPDGGILPQQNVVQVTSTPAVDPLTVQITYTPNGTVPPQDPDSGQDLFVLALPKGPSITALPRAALPCGAMVSVALNPAKVRSHDQRFAFQPKAGVSSTLAFASEPLTAVIDVPQPPPPEDGGVSVAGVASDASAKVTFNTIMADTEATHIVVSVTTAGAGPATDIGTVTLDAADNHNVFTVAPPDTGWPAGATVAITVQAEAADGYGVPLGAPVSSSFVVAP